MLLRFFLAQLPFMRLLLPLLFSLSLAALAVDDYKLGPLSQEKPDVPKGQVIPMPVHESKSYAGTKRDWWIHMPAQYEPKSAATLHHAPAAAGRSTSSAADGLRKVPQLRRNWSPTQDGNGVATCGIHGTNGKSEQSTCGCFTF